MAFRPLRPVRPFVEFGAAFGLGSVFSVISVASVFESGQNGDADVEAEPIPHPMQQLPDGEFGAGVLAADAAHVP